MALAELKDLVTIGTSLLAVVFSSISLAITLLREFRRPRLIVRASIARVLGGADVGPPYVSVTALNSGPLANKAKSLLARKAWWRRWLKPDDYLVFVQPNFDHPASTSTGEKIEVGDTYTFAIPVAALKAEGGAFSHGFYRFGVHDGFGRTHWISAKAAGRLERDTTTARLEEREARWRRFPKSSSEMVAHDGDVRPN